MTLSDLPFEEQVIQLLQEINENTSETEQTDITIISEKLDTIIEYENSIHYAIWSLIGLIAFITVARLLWTMFDKWFFGGV